MRCVTIDRFGNPAEVLALGERAMPQPGVGEVRLKMILSPIHNHDLSIVRGEYGYKPPLPAVPGSEAVASVDALGDGVTGLALGQRVSVAGATGTWAEYFLAKAAAVIPLPDSVPDAVACQLLAMPLSASMLVDDLAMQAGEWMIQNTANGAVGRIVNTIAEARGIKVINLVRSAESADSMRTAGYINVLASDDPDWSTKVPVMTDGMPVVRAIDSIGGRAANDLMNVLGVGGTLVSFGAMSRQPLSIDVGNILFKQATVRGFWGAKRMESTSAAERGRMVSELIGLAASGALRLQVAASFNLADAAEAATASAEPNRPGKIALRG